MNIIEKAIQIGSAKAGGDGRPARRRNTPRPAPEPVADPTEPVSYSILVEHGLLAEKEQDSGLIEQLRHLKRPVLENAFGPLAEHGGNVVMITSALAGAGKSFTSASLAECLAAERDRSVVIVDLDNIKATLTNALGLRDRMGFFDVIDNPKLHLKDATVPTDIANLMVIPTGRRFEDSAELLSCERARNLIQRLAEEDPARIVVLDTPPLLSTPDAHAVTRLADQLLIVVEAGVTNLSSLRKILPSIDTGKPVGLVLNKCPASAWLSQYGGDYYGPAYGSR